MKKALAIVSFLLCSITSDVTFAHEDNFEERVREYLLSNPEVILEALEVLTQQDVQAELNAKLSAYPDIYQASAIGMGMTDAQTKVVEFFDYRCAPCKAIHPKLEALVEANPGLRIEMRHLPILSPGSERAARFALATELVAGAEAYVAVHDAIWALQGPLNEAGFERIANDLGLDFEAIKAEMKNEAVDAEIDHNRVMAIDLGILGTPAFVTKTSLQFGTINVDALAEEWLSQ